MELGKHTAPVTGPTAAGPPVTAGVIVHATLVLLAIAIPQSLVNRLEDFDPSPAHEVLLRAAETIETVSTRLGANRPYRFARDIFLNATGKNED